MIVVVAAYRERRVYIDSKQSSKNGHNCASTVVHVVVVRFLNHATFSLVLGWGTAPNHFTMPLVVIHLFHDGMNLRLGHIAMRQ